MGKSDESSNVENGTSERKLLSAAAVGENMVHISQERKSFG